jgi:hypothetical protein
LVFVPEGGKGLQGSAEKMMINLKGAELFSLKQSVENEASDEHVLIIDFELLADRGRLEAILLIDDIEVDIRLEQSL